MRMYVKSGLSQPIIIDVIPEETGLSTDVIRSSGKKSEIGKFIAESAKDGAKQLGKFIVWTLKNMLILLRETLKMAAEGNREMNEEIRNSQRMANGRTLRRK